MDSIKPPAELDFHSGILSENWRRWSETMKIFLNLGMAKAKEDEQCSAFLYIIGQGGSDIFETLTIPSGQENKIEALFEVFKVYCTPKKNLTIERHKFNTRFQGKDETVDEYITDLKTIAKRCNFGTLTDELVRDRIVCGTNSESVKVRLLRSEDLTLEKAVTVCKAEEESLKQIRHLGQDTSVHSVKKKFDNKPRKEHKWDKPKTENSTNKTAFNCRNCGKVHGKRECPA